MVLRFREVDREKFEAVLSGRKSVETRAATEKFRAIKPGDVVTVVCGDDSAQKTVKSVRHFKDIASLLEAIPQDRILPGTSRLEEAEEIYYGFPGYKEKIAQHGLLAFELE